MNFDQVSWYCGVLIIKWSRPRMVASLVSLFFCFRKSTNGWVSRGVNVL